MNNCVCVCVYIYILCVCVCSFFFIHWHFNLHGLFNAEPILVEEQSAKSTVLLPEGSLFNSYYIKL